MGNNRRHKLVTIGQVISSLVFLLGGSVLLTDGKIVFGSLQIMTAAINFILLIKPVRKQRKLTIIAFILNIIVALTMAFDYYQAGARYLPYAWLIGAIFFMIALLVYIKKSKKIEAG